MSEMLKIICEECGFKKPPDPECGTVYDLTPQERALAEIIYWARNKKKGLKFCIDRQFYPGPRGHKDKSGLWFPHPTECCDSGPSVYGIIEKDVSESQKWAERTYAWRNHCKTIPHIEYLIKNRFNWIFENVLNWGAPNCLKTMLDMIINKNYPLYISDERWIIQEFVEDLLKGSYVSPYKNSEVGRSK